MFRFGCSYTADFLPLPFENVSDRGAGCIEGIDREELMRRKGGGEHLNMAYDHCKIR